MRGIWITDKLLQHLGACKRGRRYFNKLYPNGRQVTARNVKAAREAGLLVSWLSQAVLLNGTAERQKYDDLAAVLTDEMYASFAAARVRRDKAIQEAEYNYTQTRMDPRGAKATRDFWLRHAEELYEFAAKRAEAKHQRQQDALLARTLRQRLRYGALCAKPAPRETQKA